MNEDQLHQIASERNITDPISVASQSSIIPPATQHEADASERSWGQLFKDMGQSFLDAIDIPLLSPIARPLMAAADTPRWRTIQDARAIMANKRKQSDLLMQNASQHEANKLALEQNAIEQGKANVQSTFLKNMGLEQSLPIEQKILENRLEISDLLMQNASQHEANKLVLEQNAIEQGKANVQSTFLKNMGLEQSLPIEQKILENRLESSNLNLAKQFVDTATANGDITTNAFLYGSTEFPKIQDKENQQEVMGSREYINYNTFNAMSDLALRAMDDLAKGNSNSHAIQAMQVLAARVSCRFVQDEKGLPCLVDSEGQVHELTTEKLKKFKQDAEAALINKTHEVLGHDAGSRGGLFSGEAYLYQTKQLTDYGMMSRAQSRETYDAVMKEFRQSPFLRDVYEMSATLNNIMNAHEGMDIFAQANVENLSEREKNALLSIMGISSKDSQKPIGLAKYGIEVKPNQAGSWTVFDQNRQLSGKTQFDVRELPAILKQNDYVGRVFEKIAEDSRKTAIDAQAAQEAKLTGMILRNNARGGTGGLGEGDTENVQIDKDGKEISDEVTTDVKVKMSRDTNGKSDEWTNETRKNYLDANNETLHDALIDGFAVATKRKNEKGEDVINYQLDTDKLTDLKKYIALRNLVTRDEARLKRGALGKENLQSEYRPYLTAMQHEIDNKIHAARLKKEGHGRLLAIRNLMKGIDLPVKWKGKDLKSRQADLDVVRNLSRESAKGLRLYDKNLEPLYELKESAPEKFKQLCKVTRELYDSELRLNANVTEQEREQFIENLSN